jgi:hypothetical protein
VPKLMTPNRKLTNVIKGRIIEDLQMNPAEVSMRFSDGSRFIGHCTGCGWED